jgi:exopolysaccharide biosynthesis WecB/TagA/CpsF family protein
MMTEAVLDRPIAESSANPEPSLGDEGTAIRWPRKHDVCGVLVSQTHYQEVVDRLMQAAHQRIPAVCSFFSVHALVTASDDPTLRENVNSFDVVAPDGQPVRWALNRLYGTKLDDRVYGPETMLRLCRRAAEEGVSIYLYGCANSEILDALQERLRQRFVGLDIVGAEVPPFRPLTPEEDAALVERINGSGAGLLFIGLGCPKQDLFAAAHCDRLALVQCCVGAAFDFHAGKTKMAPAWMQSRGLEWLFRLSQEPRRLWKRYLVTNVRFLAKFGRQWARSWFAPAAAPRRATTELTESSDGTCPTKGLCQAIPLVDSTTA